MPEARAHLCTRQQQDTTTNARGNNTYAQGNNISRDGGPEAVGSRGSAVDLEQPHPKIRINNKIVAVELKAAVIVFAAELRPRGRHGAHDVLANLAQDIVLKVYARVVLREVAVELFRETCLSLAAISRDTIQRISSKWNAGAQPRRCVFYQVLLQRFRYQALEVERHENGGV
jgi:hypothetical protein